MAPPSSTTVVNIACVRCRHRKKRCDQVTPTCGQCASAGATCVRFTERKQRSVASVPWEYVHRLESRIDDMEQTLAACVSALDGSRGFRSNPDSALGSSNQQRFPWSDKADEREGSDAMSSGSKRVLSDVGMSNDLSQQDTRLRGSDMDCIADLVGYPSSDAGPSQNCLPSPGPGTGQDLVTVANLRAYIEHINPVWAFLDEGKLQKWILESDCPEAHQNDYKSFFVQVSCAVGCFYPHSRNRNQQITAQSEQLFNQAVHIYMEQTDTQHLIHQLQTYLLIIIYVAHSANTCHVRNIMEQAVSHLAERLCMVGRLLESSGDVAENHWLNEMDVQGDGDVKTVLIFSYSAYEWIASIWDRPYEEFPEFCDEKAWEQISSHSSGEVVKDMILQHQFSIRRLQTSVRRFWSLFDTYGFEERLIQRTTIKDALDRWWAMIPLTSSTVDRSTNYHPLAMMKLYDQTICNLYQRGDNFPIEEDCPILLSAANENCRCFRRIQTLRPFAYITWTGLLEQFHSGLIILACFWETPYHSRTLLFDSPDTLQGLDDCDFTLLKFAQEWDAAMVYHETFKLIWSHTPISFPQNVSFTLPDEMIEQLHAIITKFHAYGLSHSTTALISRIIYRSLERTDFSDNLNHFSTVT